MHPVDAAFVTCLGLIGLGTAFGGFRLISILSTREEIRDLRRDLGLSRVGTADRASTSLRRGLFAALGLWLILIGVATLSELSALLAA